MRTLIKVRKSLQPPAAACPLLLVLLLLLIMRVHLVLQTQLQNAFDF